MHTYPLFPSSPSSSIKYCVSAGKSFPKSLPHAGDIHHSLHLAVHMNELTNGSVFVLNCKTCLLCASFGEFVATFRKICTVGSFDINALFLFGIVDKASEPPDKIALCESNNSFPFENSIFFSPSVVIIIVGQKKIPT